LAYRVGRSRFGGGGKTSELLLKIALGKGQNTGGRIVSEKDASRTGSKNFKNSWVGAQEKSVASNSQDVKSASG